MNTLNRFIGALLVFFTMHSFAAGDCSPLSGQYVIGKSEGADFQSLNDAANALKCGGVSAPVVLLLETGTYNERLALQGIPGASAFNSVTIESKSGNNADVIISFSSGDATVSLFGTSYLTIENLTLDHKASTYGNTLLVDGRASNLRFKGVVFDGVESARTGSNNAVVYFTPNAIKSQISFEDCEINNGSSGIYKGGVSADAFDTKTSITGTLFFNQYETGLTLANEDAPVIINNVISSLSSYEGYKAINLDGIANGVMISNNIVNAANGSIGIAMNNSLAQPTYMGEITNNSIAVGGKGETYDIYLTGTTDNQILNFNRFKLTLNGAPKDDQAFYKNSGSGNNVNMMNNICYDLGAGGYTIVGNSYKDFFNQLPPQSNPALTVSANGIMIEKVSPIK